MSLLNRLCFYSGMITLFLFFATGMYARTITRTRRYLAQTNKALRAYYLRLVPNPVRKWLLPLWWRKRGLGQGGVRLVLLAKGLDDDFRQGWEVFRAEYWESEEQRLARRSNRARPGKPVAAPGPHDDDGEPAALATGSANGSSAGRRRPRKLSNSLAGRPKPAGSAPKKSRKAKAVPLEVPDL